MLKSTKKEKDPCQGQIFYVLRHRKKKLFLHSYFFPQRNMLDHFFFKFVIYSLSSVP